MGPVDTSNSPFARLRPGPALSLGAGSFWQPRREKNATASLPQLLGAMEEAGTIDNFRRLIGEAQPTRRGPRYTDSDLFKWMEACAWGNREWPITQFGPIEDIVVRAQGADGYLNTYFVDELADKRFSNMIHDHEVYCAGHLFQAAIAARRSIGETKLFDAAIRYADYLCEEFGPGKREEADGHPEAEMALIELYRETGEEKYLKLAKFYLDQVDWRGASELEGHAVRALYFCCGLADCAMETGDSEAMGALQRYWRSMMETRLYVTGGAGGRHVGESFGRPYELPNERAYAETCAAIAVAMWAHRMLLLTGDGQYGDAMELALYNGFLAGVSLSGTDYFYVNPLRSNGKAEGDPWYPWARKGPPQRVGYYECACCPPNIQRTFASLPHWFVSRTTNGVWAHLFDNGVIELGDGGRIVSETDYPWSGEVLYRFETDNPFEFRVRQPEWSDARYWLNGEECPCDVEKGYAKMARHWRKGDELKVDLGMAANWIECNPRVAENRGSVALKRGPLVYCLEAADNENVLDAVVRAGAETRLERLENLDGVQSFRFSGFVDDAEWPTLYRREGSARLRPMEFLAVPYYAWNNRGAGAMTVWMRRVDERKG